MLGAWRRRRLARRAPAGPLRDFLATPPRPGALLAVDVETTGLDARTDHLLSIGWVPVDEGRIRLSGATRLVVSADAEVGRSATIHGITDDDLGHGIALREALDLTLAALTGRTMVAHHAPVEEGFLGAAVLATYGVRPLFTTVDTLVVERERMARRGEEPGPGALRLPACLERHGLPAAPLHDALSDALACAELHLAQTAPGPVSPRGSGRG